MQYDAEVNNGGHAQYFDHVDNCGDLRSAVEKVLAILPNPLRDNLKKAYDSFVALEGSCDDEEDPFAECDDVFYNNEQLLLNLLNAYASSLGE